MAGPEIGESLQVFRDAPIDGGLSLQLLEWLIKEDMQDMATLFRVKGVNTVKALLDLTSADRAALRHKCQDLYIFYGWLAGNMELAFDRLFLYIHHFLC